MHPLKGRSDSLLGIKKLVVEIHCVDQHSQDTEKVTSIIYHKMRSLSGLKVEILAKAT